MTDLEALIGESIAVSINHNGEVIRTLAFIEDGCVTVFDPWDGWAMTTLVGGGVADGTARMLLWELVQARHQRYRNLWR
jgi:hypothetical protein